MTQPEGELFSEIEAFLQSADQPIPEERPVEEVIDWSKRGLVISAFLRQYLWPGMKTEPRRTYVGFSVFRNINLGKKVKIGDLSAEEAHEILQTLEINEVSQFASFQQDACSKALEGLTLTSEEYEYYNYWKMYYGVVDRKVQESIEWHNQQNA